MISLQLVCGVECCSNSTRYSPDELLGQILHKFEHFFRIRHARGLSNNSSTDETSQFASRDMNSCSSSTFINQLLNGRNNANYSDPGHCLVCLTPFPRGEDGCSHVTRTVVSGVFGQFIGTSAVRQSAMRPYHREIFSPSIDEPRAWALLHSQHFLRQERVEIRRVICQSIVVRKHVCHPRYSHVIMSEV